MRQRKDYERRRIKESYSGKGRLLPLLLEQCLVSCGSGNAVPTIYGFRRAKEVDGLLLYYYVTYLKIPDTQYLFVGEEFFEDYQECLRRRKERTRYFPRYGFSSLNIRK